MVLEEIGINVGNIYYVQLHCTNERGEIKKEGHFSILANELLVDILREYPPEIDVHYCDRRGISFHVYLFILSALHQLASLLTCFFIYPLYYIFNSPFTNFLISSFPHLIELFLFCSVLYYKFCYLIIYSLLHVESRAKVEKALY